MRQPLHASPPAMTVLGRGTPVLPWQGRPTLLAPRAPGTRGLSTGQSSGRIIGRNAGCPWRRRRSYPRGWSRRRTRGRRWRLRWRGRTLHSVLRSRGPGCRGMWPRSSRQQGCHRTRVPSMVWLRFQDGCSHRHRGGKGLWRRARMTKMETESRACRRKWWRSCAETKPGRGSPWPVAAVDTAAVVAPVCVRPLLRQSPSRPSGMRRGR
mmetsp:Transcript_88577/g.236758  ORF Transcript_88577/g.236758 Transcript_88577/m.236758 type:complete len:209 (+) Transcript_88577:996-1622(+)